MFKVMVKVSVNVAYDSEIAEEKMVVVLQNQAFDVGVFWTMRNFWYCCRQKMTKTGQIYYITMFVRLSVYKTGYHSFVLCHVSGLPDTMKTFYCYIVSFIEELCVVPRWLSYPCTYGDMILRFGRCVSDISLIFYQIPILFHARFDHLSFFFFFSLLSVWLSSENLFNYANAVYNRETVHLTLVGISLMILSRAFYSTDGN